MLRLENETVKVWSGSDVIYYAIYPIPRVRVCVWRKGTLVEGQIIDERAGSGHAKYGRFTFGEQPDGVSMEQVCRMAARAVAGAFELEG